MMIPSDSAEGVSAMMRKGRSSAQGIHPTKELLIETVVGLLDHKGPDEITSDEVLEVSGISRGSLYHHFEDFPQLMAAAHAARFTVGVDQSIKALTAVLTSATDRRSLLAALHKVTVATQAPERAALRFERARALAMAGHDPRMREMLAAEQTRLTDALTDLIREAQERGWYRREFDPRAAAVLIQAYTLGKVVDDVAEEPMDPQAWNDLIDQVIERVFAAPE